jgi:hypothetical protein
MRLFLERKAVGDAGLAALGPEKKARQNSGAQKNAPAKRKRGTPNKKTFQRPNLEKQNGWPLFSSLCLSMTAHEPEIASASSVVLTSTLSLSLIPKHQIFLRGGLCSRKMTRRANNHPQAMLISSASLAAAFFSCPDFQLFLSAFSASCACYISDSLCALLARSSR